jgi:hypothetical protein
MIFSNNQEKRTEREIDHFIEEVTHFFNREIVEAAARSTGFVERESKLTGFLFLSVFTFGMSIYGTPSLEQLIGLLNKIVPGLTISRQGLHERINEKAVEFFEYMLSVALELQIPRTLNIKGILKNFERVLILDSTSFELPENLAEVFKGSGGDASEAAVKIQFCYDLKSAHFYYLLQDGVSADNKYANGFVNHVREGDLIIKDLGYFNTQVFIVIAEQGGYYLSRLKSRVNLYVKNSQGHFVKFDLISFLNKVPAGKLVEIEVFLRHGERYTPTRLVIQTVPEQVKNKRLRKINEANRKKGRTTSQETKILQGFNLYISNAPEEQLAKEHFRALYGIRWQVELVFKNWKSNFKLDQVSGMKEERIKCMLYAKLLFTFISMKIIYLARNFMWLHHKKEVSEHRAAKQLIGMAEKWLELIIQAPTQIKSLLINTLNFITTHCIKIKQKDRVYPLELLDRLS